MANMHHIVCFVPQLLQDEIMMFVYLQWNTVNPTSQGTGKIMSDHPCCRINRGKIHGGDIKGTENKMSDHPCCRINRGRINRVPL